MTPAADDARPEAPSLAPDGVTAEPVPETDGVLAGPVVPEKPALPPDGADVGPAYDVPETPARKKRRPLHVRLVRNRYTQRARFLVLRLLYGWWRATRPVVPGRVVFASDSRATLSGNLGFIAEDMAKRYPDHEILTLLKPAIKARRSRRDAFRMPWLLATAEVIVIDDYYPIIYSLKLRPETRLAQVWHAAGAFKLVGFSRGSRPGGPLPGSNVHRGYSFVTVSSEQVRANYAEAFGAAVDVVQPLGVPRTDVFFDEGWLTPTRDRVRKELGLREDDRVVLYAPTFRGRGQKTARFDLTQFDWSDFMRTVKAGDDGRRTVVLLKQHPFVKPPAPEVCEELGFQDVSSYREVNDLLLVADVLVTDYSSVIFEYALLRRPIVFFTPDLEEYVEHRDFYYPFDTYLVGPVAATTEELGPLVASALVEGIDDPSRYDDFVERFVGACDGRSTQRVTDALLGRSGPDGPATPPQP